MVDPEKLGDEGSEEETPEQKKISDKLKKVAEMTDKEYNARMSESTEYEYSEEERDEIFKEWQSLEKEREQALIDWMYGSDEAIKEDGYRKLMELEPKLENLFKTLTLRKKK